MSNKLLCKLFISYSTASFRTVFLDEEVRQPHTRPISTILHTHPLTAIHSLGHNNIPGLSQDPRSIFPVPCHQPAMFKYRDKQLYYDSSIIRGVYVHHCHWMYYTEQRCADEHILASASTSLPSKFQEFPGPRALRFPGLFRSWQFYKNNSRTFREVWERCIHMHKHCHN